MQYCTWVLKIQYIPVENFNLKSTLWCSRAKGELMIFLSFSKTRLWCLLKIKDLVFSFVHLLGNKLMIHSAVAWCCYGKHNNHLIFSVASFVLLLRPRLTSSMSRGIIIAFVFQVVSNSSQERKKMSSNLWMITLPLATWILNYFWKCMEIHVYCAFF